MSQPAKSPRINRDPVSLAQFEARNQAKAVASSPKEDKPHRFAQPETLAKPLLILTTAPAPRQCGGASLTFGCGRAGGQASRGILNPLFSRGAIRTEISAPRR